MVPLTLVAATVTACGGSDDRVAYAGEFAGRGTLGCRGGMVCFELEGTLVATRDRLSFVVTSTNGNSGMASTRSCDATFTPMPDTESFVVRLSDCGLHRSLHWSGSAWSDRLVGRLGRTPRCAN